jgi:hypothetical protein
MGPKALEAKGPHSQRVLVQGNVITDADSDHATLVKSVIGPVLTAAQVMSGK